MGEGSGLTGGEQTRKAVEGGHTQHYTACIADKRSSGSSWMVGCCSSREIHLSSLLNCGYYYLRPSFRLSRRKPEVLLIPLAAITARRRRRDVASSSTLSLPSTSCLSSSVEVSVVVLNGVPIFFHVSYSWARNFLFQARVISQIMPTKRFTAHADMPSDIFPEKITVFRILRRKKRS